MVNKELGERFSEAADLFRRKVEAAPNRAAIEAARGNFSDRLTSIGLTVESPDITGDDNPTAQYFIGRHGNVAAQLSKKSDTVYLSDVMDPNEEI